ncbi:MAG: HTH domain-containing protein [Gammaproteobacteria bacterium]|nr:HTH domain-containing protein [Gammaproteobacteria bacterium]
MTIPDPILEFFRDRPLEEVESVQRVLLLLVQGRRVVERNNTVQEMIEALLVEYDRPMDINEILLEFNTRYPGRSSESSLRTTIYRVVKEESGRLCKVAPARFGLRAWESTASIDPDQQARTKSNLPQIGSDIVADKAAAIPAPAPAPVLRPVAQSE